MTMSYICPACHFDYTVSMNGTRNFIMNLVIFNERKHLINSYQVLIGEARHPDGTKKEMGDSD